MLISSTSGKLMIVPMIRKACTIGSAARSAFIAGKLLNEPSARPVLVARLLSPCVNELPRALLP
ncbi:hypothetical protein D3C76_1654480 [compost metagenome]